MNAVLKTFIASLPAIAPGVTQEVDVIEPVTITNFTDPNTYL